jgi:hypothetical protein
MEQTTKDLRKLVRDKSKVAFDYVMHDLKTRLDQFFKKNIEQFAFIDPVELTTSVNSVFTVMLSEALTTATSHPLFKPEPGWGGMKEKPIPHFYSINTAGAECKKVLDALRPKLVVKQDRDPLLVQVVVPPVETSAFKFILEVLLRQAPPMEINADKLKDMISRLGGTVPETTVLGIKRQFGARHHTCNFCGWKMSVKEGDPNYQFLPNPISMKDAYYKEPEHLYHPACISIMRFAGLKEECFCKVYNRTGFFNCVKTNRKRRFEYEHSQVYKEIELTARLLAPPSFSAAASEVADTADGSDSSSSSSSDDYEISMPAAAVVEVVEDKQNKDGSDSSSDDYEIAAPPSMSASVVEEEVVEDTKNKYQDGSGALSDSSSDDDGQLFPDFG